MKSNLPGILCVSVVMIVELMLVISFRESCHQKLRCEGVSIVKIGDVTMATILDVADHDTVIAFLLCNYPDVERIHFDIPQGIRTWEWNYDEVVEIRKRYRQAFPQTDFTVYVGAF